MAIIVKINTSGNVGKRRIYTSLTGIQIGRGVVGISLESLKKKKKQTKTKIELPYDPDMPALVSKSQHSTEIFALA